MPPKSIEPIKILLPKIILGLTSSFAVKSVPPVKVNPPMTPEVAVTAPVNDPVAALSVPANVAVPSDKIERKTLKLGQ